MGVGLLLHSKRTLAAVVTGRPEADDSDDHGDGGGGQCTNCWCHMRRGQLKIITGAREGTAFMVSRRMLPPLIATKPPTCF